MGDPGREFGSAGFGKVAWKERVDGWKMKQEKNGAPMSVSHAPSEGRGGLAPSEGRGGVDIDASTDVVMDDTLL